MKLHLLIILSLFFIVVGFGQDQTQINRQIFAPAFEEFSVEAPAAFEPNFSNQYDDIDRVRGYHIFQDKTFFFVFSDSLKKPYMVNVALNFIGQPLNNISQKAQFKFVDQSEYYHKILIVKTSKRYYTFQTVSETENNLEVEKFFDRIKINGELIDTKELKSVGNNAAPNPGSQDLEKKVPSPGLGTGSGSGNGTGTVPPKSSTGETTPLKIFSKASPVYTDYARDYQITGSVMVRVTFLANVTIGAVTPYKKLPFGLAEKAVEAAKQITFEPQKRDGQPLNVIKIVDYKFILY